MQSRSYLFLIIVAVLGIVAGLIYKAAPYKLGLDVSGGARFTYQVAVNGDAKNPSANPNGQSGASEGTMAKVQKILENRIASVTGVSEGNVIIKGTDQVIVEIPGYINDIQKAQEQIGTSASLKAYFASTVQADNPGAKYRRYAIGGNETGDAPSVDFTDTITKQTLKPGDPAYTDMINGWQLLISGDQLLNAAPQNQGNGSYIPVMSFTTEGGNKLRDWSEKYRGQGEMLAFVLDNRVLEIAPVKKDSVLGDQVQIDGTFKTEYVKNLTALLNAGALPVDLKLLSAEKVDPTIGTSALHKMVTAGVAAFAVVSVFLIVYYAFPGFVAFLALSLYVLFTLAVLKMMGATFSLAAIAGFVLSVGMAVDANILVFERFKEEIKKGKPLHNALQLGFSRALPAIVDSNACSILTSLVLASIGTGPVKGFATTLIIGVVISLFTAVTVTRSLLFFLTDSGIGNNPKMYGLNRNWFGEHLESDATHKPLQIVNNNRRWFTITAIVILIGIVFIGMGGIKPNVELAGGYEAEYAVTTGFPTGPQIVTNLEKNNLKGGNVKFGTLTTKSGAEQKIAYITIPGNQLAGKSPNERNAFVGQAAGIGDAQPLGFTEVGPAIQKETTQNAIIGVLASFALITIYLGFRFGLSLGSFTNGLRFGAAAIGAGLKDILVLFGFAAIVGKIAGWEISALFITSILTVIGFSVHDKIVIFDRVRENLRHPLTGEDFENLVNRSVTQSFARSINTAATVVVTLGVLVGFGTTTPDLKFFVLSMLMGIAWGTYSSIYTAAPVLYLIEKWVEKNKGEAATLMHSARAELAKNRVLKSATAPVAPTAAPGEPQAPAAGRTYGQVKRRASAVSRSKVELDDD